VAHATVRYAFTATALTSKIWLIEQQPDDTFKASARAER